jgi:hypothetical protein
MKTLDTSLGYRLMWALDRLGWQLTPQQQPYDAKFPAPYQSTAKWPHWMEPADRDELKLRVIEDGTKYDAYSDKSGDDEAP